MGGSLVVAGHPDIGVGVGIETFGLNLAFVCGLESLKEGHKADVIDSEILRLQNEKAETGS